MVLSSSHGSRLFHVKASNRHSILLMLTCRSQSEAKTPITISINNIPPPASLQHPEDEAQQLKPHASPSWSTSPAKRKRNSCVCTCSSKDGVTDYKSKGKVDFSFERKELAKSLLFLERF